MVARQVAGQRSAATNRPSPLDEAERQVLLACEVAEECPLRHVDGVCDLVHRCVLISFGLEQVERGVDERIAGLALLTPPPGLVSDTVSCPSCDFLRPRL